MLCAIPYSVSAMSMYMGFLISYPDHCRKVALRDSSWEVMMAPQRIAQPFFVASLVALLLS